MPTGLAQEGFPGQRKDGKLWGTVSYTKAGYCFQISDGLGGRAWGRPTQEEVQGPPESHGGAANIQ